MDSYNTVFYVWLLSLSMFSRFIPVVLGFHSFLWPKTLESPLDCKEIQPVHPKGDQSWVFTGRTDVEAETPIFWPPGAKSWLIGKDPDAGKDWGQEEKGTIVGWMASPTQWTWGDGQGGLACWGSWGRKELDTTERPNWTEYTAFYLSIHQLTDIGLFLLFRYSEQRCSEHSRTSFYVNLHCHSSWIHMPRGGNVGWYGSSMLNTLRNYPTVWQSGYAVLRSHKQWVRVLMSPHLHRHLLLSFLF